MHVDLVSHVCKCAPTWGQTKPKQMNILDTETSDQASLTTQTEERLLTDGQLFKASVTDAILLIMSRVSV